MKDYHVVYEEDLAELGNAVASYLANGWELHGSPFVFVDNVEGKQTQNFAQAIVNREVMF